MPISRMSCIVNWSYLDNFLTKWPYFIAYSGELDPNKLKYHKIYDHLVRKLSRYKQFYLHMHLILIEFVLFRLLTLITIFQIIASLL